jgi:hypothetical protein
MLVEDNDIIYAISANAAIREGFGKKASIHEILFSHQFFGQLA